MNPENESKFLTKLIWDMRNCSIRQIGGHVCDCGQIAWAHFIGPDEGNPLTGAGLPRRLIITLKPVKSGIFRQSSSYPIRVIPSSEIS